MEYLQTIPRLAFVALGSNLGDSVRILRDAARRLEVLSAGPLRRSSLWESTPVDCPPGSPKFLNAVVGFEPGPGESAESLLLKLQELEIEFGRKPKVVLNEPRPLDLDLIALGRLQLDTPILSLPHPRAHQRRFVLEPLSEIAPELVLPGQTRTVAELLASLKTDEVVRRIGSL